MGGGIFVVCEGLRGRKYVLVGIEYESRELKCSTFYGSTDLNETTRETACREGEEETLCLFGNRNELDKKIGNEISHSCYLLDLGILSRRRRFSYLTEFRTKRSAPNLSYCSREMKDINWVPLDKVQEFIKVNGGNKLATLEFDDTRSYPLRAIFFKICYSYFSNMSQPVIPNNTTTDVIMVDIP